MTMSARLFGMLPGLVMLIGCSNLETHTLSLQTAATGTQIEAKQVVALVYAHDSDAKLDNLLYSGGDLTKAIKLLRTRHPKLVPLLNQGVVGNTVSGYLALREMESNEALRDLVWDENRDRAFLYNRTSAEVGHGGSTLTHWLPYASATFGHEWIAQGNSGWWWLDEHQQWHQRPDAANR